MAKRRVYAVVEGRVQGVFFRAHTREEAMALDLTGWVRNRADGAVEAEIEGESGDVERMLQWLHQGSPASRVSRVRVAELPVAGNEDTFVVRHD